MRHPFPFGSTSAPRSSRAGDRRQALRQQDQPIGRIGPRHRSCHSTQANKKDRPAFFARTLSEGRARIKQAVCKLKRIKRIVLRCGKTKRNFASFVALVAGFILLKSIHTA